MENARMWLVKIETIYLCIKNKMEIIPFIFIFTKYVDYNYPKLNVLIIIKVIIYNYELDVINISVY